MDLLVRDDSPYLSQARENAPDLLLRALSRAPVNLVTAGDYQPVEYKFGLSQRMLEVCLDSPGHNQVRQTERLVPPPEKRSAPRERISKAAILNV